MNRKQPVASQCPNCEKTILLEPEVDPNDCRTLHQELFLCQNCRQIHMMIFLPAKPDNVVMVSLDQSMINDDEVSSGDRENYINQAILVVLHHERVKKLFGFSENQTFTLQGADSQIPDNSVTISELLAEAIEEITEAELPEIVFPDILKAPSDKDLELE